MAAAADAARQEGNGKTTSTMSDLLRKFADCGGITRRCRGVSVIALTDFVDSASGVWVSITEEVAAAYQDLSLKGHRHSIPSLMR